MKKIRVYENGKAIGYVGMTGETTTKAKGDTWPDATMAYEAIGHLPTEEGKTYKVETY